MAKDSVPSLIWFTIKNVFIITVLIIAVCALLGGAARLISYVLQFVGVSEAWAAGLAVVTTISLALSLLLTLVKIEVNNQ